MTLQSLFSRDTFIPVCLFTYETASARTRIAEFTDCYTEVEKLVIKYYGKQYMDNKITLLFRTSTENDDNILIYATYSDNQLSIGLTAMIMNDYIKPANAYRRIKYDASLVK